MATSVRIGNGRIEYYKGDLLHREDGPAIEYFSKEIYGITDTCVFANTNEDPNGAIITEQNAFVSFGQQSTSKYYYQNGQLHRDDGPAIDLNTGEKAYYQHGQLHRLDGPARIRPEYTDSPHLAREEWYVNGKPHRVGKPALIFHKSEHWMENGQYHRAVSEGPAITYPNGDKRWYFHNTLVAEFNFCRKYLKIYSHVDELGGV